MDQAHILVVDDDDRIRELLSQFLKKNNFIVSAAKDSLEAKAALKVLQLDLIILDVMLPGESGKDFAKTLRDTSNIAILMLTALSETADRIAGLEAGADDYLPKPFDPKELLLRIRKLLQRTQKNLNHNNTNFIYIGDLLFDPIKNILLKGEKEITLSTNEKKLLNYFVSHKNKIITREEISNFMDKINPRSVDVQVTRLRNKIENNPKKSTILQSVRNKGYILYV